MVVAHPTIRTIHPGAGLRDSLRAAMRRVGETLVVFLRILLKSDSDLLEVAQTRSAASRLARFGERRKQNAGQNSDNGDDNEKLDERETFLLCFHNDKNLPIDGAKFSVSCRVETGFFARRKTSFVNSFYGAAIIKPDEGGKRESLVISAIIKA